MVNEVNQAMRSYSRKTMLLPTFQMIYDVKLKNPETLLRAVGRYENPERGSIEVVSKELNHLAAILHVYVGV